MGSICRTASHRQLESIPMMFCSDQRRSVWMVQTAYPQQRGRARRSSSSRTRKKRATRKRSKSFRNLRKKRWTQAMGTCTSIPYVLTSFSPERFSSSHRAACSQVARQNLEFDFERLCSKSMTNINVYCCLVCGKYFQGRGRGSWAYRHAVGENHRVWLNLGTEKVGRRS
jgi:hypothetical protein